MTSEHAVSDGRLNASRLPPRDPPSSSAQICRRYLSDRTERHTKPTYIILPVGRMFESVRRPAERYVEAIGTTPTHAIPVLDNHWGVTPGQLRLVAVPAPLADIPVHVAESPRIWQFCSDSMREHFASVDVLLSHWIWHIRAGSTGEPRFGLSSSVEPLFPSTSIEHETKPPCVIAQLRLVISKRIARRRTGSAGVFPLRLRRQRVFPAVRQTTRLPLLFRQSLAKRGCFVPTHERCRVIGALPVPPPVHPHPQRPFFSSTLSR